ncbi:MAG: GNAT family N-acetyltransferase [Stackebrandtia sp.]
MDPTIRAATEENLKSLETDDKAEFPLAAWVERHRADRGKLFVAVVDELPIGQVYVSLEDAVEPDLRRHFPQAAVIERLEVRKGFRNLGVAGRLMDAAEDFIRRGKHDRDRFRVILGVNVDNPDPIPLYERRGYAEWLSDASGLPRRVDTHRIDGEPERCRVFVKDLTRVTNSGIR